MFLDSGIVFFLANCYNNSKGLALTGKEFDMLFDSFEFYDVQETRRVSKAEGKAEGKAEAVLYFLREHGVVSEELEKKVMSTTDFELLHSWLKLAVCTKSVEEFCRRAGL